MSNEVLPGITQGRVNQFRALRGTWRYFGCKNRAELDAKVSDEQIAQYIQEKASKKDFIENPKPELMGIGEDAFNALWDQKYAAYTARFQTDKATPNDLASLKRLAFMEAQQEVIQRHIISKLDISDISDRNVIKGLNDTLVSLSREMREIEKQLGVDRVTRQKAEDADNPLEVLRQGIADAKWLIDNEIQEVRCPGCESKIDVPILSIWHHYPTHPPRPVGAKGEYAEGEALFHQECPNCGRILVVRYKPRGVPLRAKDFEIPDLTALGRE